MLIKIIIICLMSAILMQLFKNLSSYVVPFIALCSGIVVFAMLFQYIKNALIFVEVLTQNVSGLNESIKISVKTVGISIICDFASQLCSDMGEGYLSSKIEFAGKIIIFCMIIPELIVIIETVTEMIMLI